MGKSRNKTKPFIDKKKSTTYSILPKTQAELALLNEDGNGDAAAAGDPRASSNSDDPFAEWKGRLREAGIALSEDELAHRYLKEMGDGGIFVDAASGRTAVARQQAAAASAAQNRLLQPQPPQAHPGWTEDPDDPNSLILFDNVDLTLDCMDEDMRRILGLAEQEDDDEFGVDGDEALGAGELDDDFCLQAAQDPAADMAPGAFDYDAHIRQLLERARREREEGEGWEGRDHPGLADGDYFANSRRGRFKEEEDDGEEYDESDLNEWMNQQTRGGQGGAEGVSSRLHPDEERALCDKFLATLAEYEEDDSDDDEGEEGHGDNRRELIDDDGSHEQQVAEDEDDEDDEDVDSQDAEYCRALGDDELEAALDDFLRENQEEILIQGHGRQEPSRRKNESGGSGYSFLVGTRMVPAPGLKKNGAEPGGEDEAAELDPPGTVAEILAEADETLQAPIQFLTLDSVITVDEFDGKSYFTERSRNPWDCESILSTYSNLDNNPAVISHAGSSRRRKNRVAPKETAAAAATRIVLSAKTGLPIRHADAGSPEEEHHENGDGVSVEASTVGANRGLARNKNETKEEKRARKAAAKQERQAAQMRKKALRDAFGQELQKRSAVAATDAPAGSAVFRYA